MYKNYVEGKKAVFFDLDGTLVDNATLWKEANKEVYKSTQIPIPEYFDKEYEFGMSSVVRWKEVIQAQGLADYSPQQLSELTDAAYLKLLDKSDLKVREGFWELIYDLKENLKMKVAVVTSSTLAVAIKTLEKIEIEKAFDEIITGDQIKNPKPDPYIYLLSAKKLGIKPKEVLVFEDSLTGAKSAAKASMDMIIIWDTKTPQYLFPGKIFTFTTDFEGFAGNLDKSILDVMREASEYYRSINTNQQSEKKPGQV